MNGMGELIEYQMNSRDEERLGFTKDQAQAARWGAITSNVLLPIALAYLGKHYTEAEARDLLRSFNDAVETRGFSSVTWEEFTEGTYSRR